MNADGRAWKQFSLKRTSAAGMDADKDGADGEFFRRFMEDAWDDTGYMRIFLCPMPFASP